MRRLHSPNVEIDPRDGWASPGRRLFHQGFRAMGGDLWLLAPALLVASATIPSDQFPVGRTTLRRLSETTHQLQSCYPTTGYSQACLAIVRRKRRHSRHPVGSTRSPRVVSELFG